MTTFTLEELQVLMNMLDLATKAGGLQVAQNTLLLANKIQKMAAELAQEVPPAN